jgi:hypothetical protein
MGKEVNHTKDPGPQSECPESHWLLTDLLFAVGLVAAIAYFAIGG